MQGMTKRLPEWRRKVAAIVGEKKLTGADYAGNYIFDQLALREGRWVRSRA